ncbi:leucine-rich repeat-containing protein [Tanacetum coccineum]
MLSTWRPEEEDDCCQWLGVASNNQTGHVTKLALYGSPYSSSLEVHNESTGTIPESIGNMTQLTHLGLDVNKFNGVIPESIGSLSNLTHLDLHGNKFSGTIPRSIVKISLVEPFQCSLVSDNVFYGTILREFGNLTNLEYLYLDSLKTCRVENLDWLSSLSSLGVLIMDGTSLAKANN